MTTIAKISGASLCLAMAFLAASSAQAQSSPAAAAPAGATTPQPAGSDKLFASWDTDHNGSLSPAEFKVGWRQVQMAMIASKLHDNFVEMDTNRSGALEAAEYAKLELIKKAGASAPPMSKFDADKSQGLDFKEYVNMVKAMLQGKP